METDDSGSVPSLARSDRSETSGEDLDKWEKALRQEISSGDSIATADLDSEVEKLKDMLKKEGIE